MLLLRDELNELRLCDARFCIDLEASALFAPLPEGVRRPLPPTPDELEREAVLDESLGLSAANNISVWVWVGLVVHSSHSQCLWVCIVEHYVCTRGLVSLGHRGIEKN